MLASSEKVQRGIDFVQDKIEKAEGLVLVVDDLAVSNGKDAASTRRCSRRGLILGGVILVGVIVTVVVIRSRRKTSSGEDVEDTTEILT